MDNSVTSRYQPCPLSPAHLKVLDMLLAWNLPKEALAWILEGKPCSHRLKEKWGRENEERVELGFKGWHYPVVCAMKQETWEERLLGLISLLGSVAIQKVLTSFF